MPARLPSNLARANEQEVLRVDGAIDGAISEARGARGKAGAKATAEDRVIGFFSWLRSLADKVWTVGWITVPGMPMALPIPQFAAMGLGALAGLMRKAGWKSIATWLETFRTAGRMGWEPLHFALEVPVGKIHTLPGAVMHEAAAIAGGKATMMGKEVGESHMARYQAGILKLAEQVDARMNRLATQMGERTAPLSASTNRAIERFGQSGVGQLISDKMSGLMSWRHARVTAAEAGSMDKAIAAFGQAPRGPIALLLRRTPKPTEMHAGLANIFSQVQAARGLQGSARADALAEVMAALKNPEFQNAGNLGHVQKYVGRAAQNAAKSSHLSEVVEGGVSALIRNAGKSMGKASIFTAAIATVAVAGGGIAFLTARKNNKQAAQELQDYKDDIGDPHSRLLKGAANENLSRAIGRNVGAALSTASDALMVSAHNSADAMNVVPVQIGVAQLGSMFEGENEAVSAHAQLKKAERGEVELSPQDHLDAMKKLVAAVPEVKAQGGMYNMLTTPVAEALIAKKGSLREVMHTLNDSAAFMQLAREVKSAQDAAKAAALRVAAEKTEEKPAQTAASPTTKVANDNLNAANDNPPPVVQIAADSAKHDGMLAARERVLA